MSFVSKYQAVLAIRTKDAFAYGAEGVVFFAADLMGPLLMMLVWKSIYSSQQVVASYTIGQMLTYYILVFVLRTVLSVYPHDLSKKIRTGEINLLLVKPVNILIDQLASEMGWKIARMAFLALATVILVKMFVGTMPLPAIRILDLGLGMALVNAFLLNYFLKAAIEMIAFWTDEVEGLRMSFYVLESFFAGIFLPLNILPTVFQTVAGWLPFRFFYYFPIQIMLGKVNQGEIVVGVISGFLWWVGVAWLTGYLLRQGLRRYAAFSG